MPPQNGGLPLPLPASSPVQNCCVHTPPGSVQIPQLSLQHSSPRAQVTGPQASLPPPEVPAEPSPSSTSSSSSSESSRSHLDAPISRPPMRKTSAILAI